MKTVNPLEFLIRATIFFVTPLGAFFLFYVNFLTIYFTTPVFTPYFYYTVDLPGYEPTIFSYDRLGWYFVTTHAAIVAIVVAYITSSKRVAFSIAVFLGITGLASLSTHLVLNLLGFEAYMGVP